MQELPIILDTNFLMIPENHKIDIFREFERIIDRKYKLLVPAAVLEELKHLEEKGTATEKKAAKIGLELAQDIKEIPSEKSADEEIIKLAEKMDCAVATYDSKLRKKLRKRGTPVIFLRQRSHLCIDGKV